MLARPASAAVAVMRSCFTTVEKLISINSHNEKVSQKDGVLTIRARYPFYLICAGASSAKWLLTLARSAGL